MRDLNNYEDLQIYCNQLKNEMKVNLTYVERFNLTLELQYNLVQRGYKPHAYILQLNGSKEYLTSWINCFMDACYSTQVHDKINWFK